MEFKADVKMTDEMVETLVKSSVVNVLNERSEDVIKAILNKTLFTKKQYGSGTVLDDIFQTAFDGIIRDAVKMWVAENTAGINEAVYQMLDSKKSGTKKIIAKAISDGFEKNFRVSVDARFYAHD